MRAHRLAQAYRYRCLLGLPARRFRQACLNYGPNGYAILESVCARIPSRTPHSES